MLKVGGGGGGERRSDSEKRLRLGIVMRVWLIVTRNTSIYT